MISMTLKQALSELGLTEHLLLKIFIAAGRIPTLTESGKWKYSNLSATDWIWICNLIHLPIDSISFGYMRFTHCAWVGRAIEQGLYVLPRTRRLESFFREYIRSKRQDIHFCRRTTGAPLSDRLKDQRRMDFISLRRTRRQNFRALEKVRFEILVQYRANSLLSPRARKLEDLFIFAKSSRRTALQKYSSVIQRGLLNHNLE